MPYDVVLPRDFEWLTRPHEPGKPARHVAELSVRAGFVHDVPTGGLVRVDPGTPLQAANHGDDDLLVYAYGYPPESESAELLDPAV